MVRCEPKRSGCQISGDRHGHDSSPVVQVINEGHTWGSCHCWGSNLSRSMWPTRSGARPRSRSRNTSAGARFRHTAMMESYSQSRRHRRPWKFFVASVFRALPTCTFRRPSGTKLSTSRTLARFNSRSAPLSRKQAVPRTLPRPFCPHDEAAVVVVEQQPMTWVGAPSASPPDLIPSATVRCTPSSRGISDRDGWLSW